MDEIDAKINSGIPDQMKSKWLAVIFKMFLSTKIKKPFSSHERSLDTSAPGTMFIIVIISATHCLRASCSIWDLEKITREQHTEADTRARGVRKIDHGKSLSLDLALSFVPQRSYVKLFAIFL